MARALDLAAGVTCISSHALERFVCGDCAPEQRPSIELHLSDCRQCRSKLIELADARLAPETRIAVPEALHNKVLALVEPTVNPEPRSNGRWTAVASAASILAVVGLSALSWFQNRPDAPSGSTGVVRSAPAAEQAPRLLPHAGSTSVTPIIELQWQGSPNAASYLVTVVDDVGEASRQFELPPGAQRLELDLTSLGPVGVYYWFVEARFSDGVSTASATKRLPALRE